jgi:hypothetical protein
MFSYVWFEQPKMAKKDPSTIQRLSLFHNLLYIRLCFRGIFATIFNDVFISPTSCLILSSATQVSDIS